MDATRVVQMKTKPENGKIAEGGQWLEKKEHAYRRVECDQSDSFSLSVFSCLLLSWESNTRKRKIIRQVAAEAEAKGCTVERHGWAVSKQKS